MQNSSAFLPGRPETISLPLQRFLAPLHSGVINTWLSNNVARGQWIVDPFGASPQVAIEAAQAGYQVLVAANNPITRFLIEMLARPPKEEDFKSALAALAATRRGKDRLEPHILNLYASECPACNQPGFARAFIWTNEASEPHAKIIRCENCGNKDEHPVDQYDVDKAASFKRGGAHRARALERIASSNDPNRKHAAEALDSYLPRSVYALFTILNRLDSIPGEARNLELIQALLLVAFDRGNNLWEHPSGRPRPKQLSNPPIFREHNIWQEMEDAISLWTSIQNNVPIVNWPEKPPESGGITLFEGSFRTITKQLSSIKISGVVTALPRPNQAFWTLSALWAGWLWGRAAIGSFASVLKRRRYDWGWHAEALQANLSHLAPHLDTGTKIFAVIGESEAGFNSAAILAGNSSGFILDGLALRREEKQLQIHWIKDSQAPESIQADVSQVAADAANELLNIRGEPSHFINIQSAALFELAKKQDMGLKSADIDDMHADLKTLVELGFTYQSGFLRYGGSSKSLEVGQWWLSDENSNRSSLADRIEIALVRILLRDERLTYSEIDQRLCHIFPGFLTPPRDLLDTLLNSYGFLEEGVWTIKSQDAIAARRKDLKDIRLLISEMGTELGYQIVENKHIAWEDQSGKGIAQFHLMASAIVNESITSGSKQTSLHKIIVLPGSRSKLLMKKIARDPKLEQALGDDWTLVKFRHIRRLAQNESLTPTSFSELLDLDPLSEDQIQAPLL